MQCNHARAHQIESRRLPIEAIAFADGFIVHPAVRAQPCAYRQHHSMATVDTGVDGNQHISQVNCVCYCKVSVRHGARSRLLLARLTTVDTTTDTPPGEQRFRTRAPPPTHYHQGCAMRGIPAFRHVFRRTPEFRMPVWHHVFRRTLQGGCSAAAGPVFPVSHTQGLPPTPPSPAVRQPQGGHRTPLRRGGRRLQPSSAAGDSRVASYIRRVHFCESVGLYFDPERLATGRTPQLGTPTPSCAPTHGAASPSVSQTLRNAVAHPPRKAWFTLVRLGSFTLNIG